MKMCVSTSFDDRVITELSVNCTSVDMNKSGQVRSNTDL